MRVAFVINKNAGLLKRLGPAVVLERLANACRLNGLEGNIELLNSNDLAQQTAAFLKTDLEIIVCGGGDGTISSVAEALVHSERHLAVLPLGTLNHFARDAGIPLELEEAVRCIAHGKPRAVDVGEVNGRFFLNNSSIGAYPQLVDEREQHQVRFGRAKWLAASLASLRLLQRRPWVHVRLDLDGETLHRRTPFVFVGNNEYATHFFAAGPRRQLSGGVLCVYTVRCTTVICFFRLVCLGLIHRLEQSRDFDKRTVTRVRIRTRRRELRVAKDGEVMRMKTPLEYRIHPAALKVITPA